MASAHAAASRDPYLYVPDEEVAEAFALGARLDEGDARLVIPHPLPRGVGPAAYERWRTREARLRWAVDFFSRMLGDDAPSPDLDELFERLDPDACHSRIYLFVQAHDARAAAAAPALPGHQRGVHWDRVLRMHYVRLGASSGPSADLAACFEWLTPAAMAFREAERVYRGALERLVRDRAAAEAGADPSPASDDDAVLYVPAEDLGEALSLGARSVAGDSRLRIPRPLPPGVRRDAFARWRTLGARHRWAVRFLSDAAFDPSPDSPAPPPPSVASPPRGKGAELFDLFRGLDEDAAHDRVYLYVPAAEARLASSIPHVGWDKRRRMHFAARDIEAEDLVRCAPWLTPAARAAWVDERAASSRLHLLVRRQAGLAIKAKKSAGDQNDIGAGAPKISRPPSRTIAD